MLSENKSIEKSLFSKEEPANALAKKKAENIDEPSMEIKYARLQQQLENLLWDNSNTINKLKASRKQLQREIVNRERLEQELRLAQKLDSIGKLAAGIAHEINTPIQFVSHNTSFLKESFSDLVPLFEKVENLTALIMSGGDIKALAEEIRSDLEEVDVEYLVEEIPVSIEQSLMGVNRVSKIVQSMKEFSHPGSNSMTFTDINHAIETTATVATNEWKYVAEMKLDLDEKLPDVECLPGELNQVVLNMIVNAAHAIADAKEKNPAHEGKITISTAVQGDFAEIRIADNGDGIAEENQQKIFDPFFTTKDVGKGTGQGLSIAYNVIVNKHGGSLDLESVVGKGTNFILQLPIKSPIQRVSE